MADKEKHDETLRSLDSKDRTSTVKARLVSELIRTEFYVAQEQHDSVTSQINEMVSIVTSSSLMISDVCEIVEEHTGRKALILLRCLSQLYQGAPSPNDAIDGVKNCARKTRQTIQGLRKNLPPDDPTLKFGMSSMLQFLSEFRSIDGTDDDVRVEYEAICLNNIGICYGTFGGITAAHKYYVEALDLLMAHFGRNALEYYIFSYVLNNIGNVFADVENFDVAGACYKRAIDAEKIAAKSKNQKEKQVEIGSTEANLRRLRYR